MVNPSPTLQTIATDTWVKATWDEFLTFADDPTLISGMQIQASQVLPGLAILLVETALVRSQTEDDGAITRWLINAI